MRLWSRVSLFQASPNQRASGSLFHEVTLLLSLSILIMEGHSVTYNLFGYRRPAGPALLAQFGPMIAKAVTLPGNHGSGLDYDQCISPPRPTAREPGPENTVSCANPWAFGCALIHYDLLSQCQFLELKCEPRATQGGHKRSQRTHKRSHVSGLSLAAPTTKDSRFASLTKIVKTIK